MTVHHEHEDGHVRIAVPGLVAPLRILHLTDSHIDRGTDLGYEGSAMNFAAGLKGNLLLIHGTGDDNCHYQTTELLINELIRHNKPFSMFAYPNRTHSIREGQLPVSRLLWSLPSVQASPIFT